MTIDPLSVWAERGLLYIFAIPKYMIMENFVALVVMVASLSVAGLLIMKNFRTKSFAGKKSRIVSILLLLNSCLLLCDMAAGKGIAFRLPLDLLLSLFALSLAAPFRTDREYGTVTQIRSEELKQKELTDQIKIS